MTNEKLYEVLGTINEKYVSEARAYPKAKKSSWAKWGAIAACLVLVCVVAIPLFLHNNDSVTTPGIADAAPMIYVNDTLYKQSTSQTSFTELKDNFVYLSSSASSRAMRSRKTSSVSAGFRSSVKIGRASCRERV